MLKVFSETSRRCDGTSRRDFLRIGSLGCLGSFGLSLGQVLREAATKNGRPHKANSVVCLWLDGGPTHIDTFDTELEAWLTIRGALSQTHLERSPSITSSFLDRQRSRFSTVSSSVHQFCDGRQGASSICYGGRGDSMSSEKELTACLTFSTDALQTSPMPRRTLLKSVGITSETD